MQNRWRIPSIVNGESNKKIVRIRFAILHLAIEVCVVGEDFGIENLKLFFQPRTMTIHVAEFFIRKPSLRILVEPLHVRMGRRGVQVVVALLHILPVISLGAAQTEETLFEDRVSGIPESERKAKPPAPIADPQQSILTPSVSARTRVVVGKVKPRLLILGVIFPNCAPLPLGKIRAPSLPMLLPRSSRDKPLVLSGSTECFGTGKAHRRLGRHRNWHKLDS
jgi:hypothetical protein